MRWPLTAMTWHSAVSTLAAASATASGMFTHLGGKRLDFLLFMAPSSQSMEPHQFPGRFIFLRGRSDGLTNSVSFQASLAGVTGPLRLRQRRPLVRWVATYPLRPPRPESPLRINLMGCHPRVFDSSRLLANRPPIFYAREDVFNISVDWSAIRCSLVPLQLGSIFGGDTQ